MNKPILTACVLLCTVQFAHSQTNTFPSSGNVGIGTSSPAFSIDINQSTPAINVNGSGFGNSGASLNLLGWAGTYKNWQIGVANIGPHGLNFTPSTIAGGSSFSGPVMTIQDDGSVGIGTVFPARLLDVNGDANIGTNLIVGTSVYTNTYTAGSIAAVNFKNSSGSNIISYLSSGNVGIGTTTPSEKLSVNGNIRSQKVIVTQSGWPDYVFSPFFKLKPLSQVGQFIDQYKHLPGMPSAKKIAEEGIDVGATETVIVRKIEELTLYMIEMKKEIAILRSENAQIKRQLKKKVL